MTSSVPSTRAPRQGAFIFIFVTVVLDMIAMGVTVPVFPKLIVDFNGGDISAASGVNMIFAATWAAMQFIFAPLLGAASDKFGRRPVILLSNLGLGLDYVFMALAPSLSWLFIGRMISGITSASYPTACAYIADVTAPEGRAAKMGMLGAAFGIGFIVGPALGGIFGGIDLRLPFWIAAGLSLANAVYGFFVLPESLPKERRGSVDLKKANPLSSLALLRSHPELSMLTVATVFMALAHESLPNVFVYYVEYRYQWTTYSVGWALFVVGICSAIVQGGLIGPMVKRFGEHACMTIGMMCGIVGFAVMGIAPISTVYLVGIPFIALWGLAGPAMQSLMSQRVSSTEQGQLQGAIGSLRGLTGVFGPIVMNGTFSLTTGSRALFEGPGTVYFLSSALLALTYLIVVRAGRARLADAV